MDELWRTFYLRAACHHLKQRLPHSCLPFVNWYNLLFRMAKRLSVANVGMRLLIQRSEFQQEDLWTPLLKEHDIGRWCYQRLLISRLAKPANFYNHLVVAFLQTCQTKLLRY